MLKKDIYNDHFPTYLNNLQNIRYEHLDVKAQIVTFKALVCVTGLRFEIDPRIEDLAK